jgi:hypothetical protein
MFTIINEIFSFDISNNILSFIKPKYMYSIENLKKKERKTEKYKNINVQLIQFDIIYDLENKPITKINFIKSFPDEFNLYEIRGSYLNFLFNKYTIFSNFLIYLFDNIIYKNNENKFIDVFKNEHLNNNNFWFPLNDKTNDIEIIKKTNEIDNFFINIFSKNYENYTYMPILIKYKSSNYIRLCMNDDTDLYKIENANEIGYVEYDLGYDDNFKYDYYDDNPFLYNNNFKVNTIPCNFLRTNVNTIDIFTMRIKFHSIWINHKNKTYGIRMDILKISKYEIY